MFNRKGISDIVRYDEAGRDRAVRHHARPVPRLRGAQGRPERQHPGRAGRRGQDGREARASSSARSRSSSPSTDKLKGKQKENVEAAADRLGLNKELARIVTDLELARRPRGLRDGGVGRRRGAAPLHVARVPVAVRPAAGGRQREAEGRCRRARPARGLGRGAAPPHGRAARPSACGWTADRRRRARRRRLRGRGTGRLRGARRRSGRSRPSLADPAAPEVGARREGPRTGRRSRRAAPSPGSRSTRCSPGTCSTPPSADYALRGLCRGIPRGRRARRRRRRRGRGPALRRRRRGVDRGRGRGDRPARARDGGADRPAGAAATARRRGAAAGVGARADGGTRRPPRRAPTSRGWGSRSATGWPRCKPRCTRMPGEEFNLNSPPAAAEILYDQLGLQPGQEDAQGRALHRRERAREAPRRAPDRRRAAVVARARQAELDVPRGAAAAGRPAGRPRAHDVQPDGGRDGPAVVVEPEPAEHPDPHRARPADPPRVRARRTRPGAARAPTTRRSSCASSRTCRATRGCARRSRAATTSTRRPPPACSGCPETRSTRGSRSRAKMVNYGLAYGMNAWGLAQRLDIAPDEAQEIMDAYFACVPGDPRLPRPPGGTRDGRGVHRDHPRAPPLHPRAAGGEPAGARPGAAAGAQRPDPGQRERRVQGRDDRGRPSARERRPTSGCHMLLTVHDELVFEVPEASVEAGRRAGAGADGARRRPRGAAAAPTSAGARTGPRPRRQGTDRRLTGFPPVTYAVPGPRVARVPLAQSQTASGEPRAPEGDRPR